MRSDHSDAVLEQVVIDYIDKKISSWQPWPVQFIFTTGTPETPLIWARYCIIGTTCLLALRYRSLDSNGCTNLRITLPVTPKLLNLNKPIVSREAYGNTAAPSYIDPLAYLLDTDTPPTIRFLNFQAGTDGQIIGINLSGEYEVDYATLYP